MRSSALSAGMSARLETEAVLDSRIRRTPAWRRGDMQRLDLRMQLLIRFTRRRRSPAASRRQADDRVQAVPLEGQDRRRVRAARPEETERCGRVGDEGPRDASQESEGQPTERRGVRVRAPVSCPPGNERTRGRRVGAHARASSGRTESRRDQLPYPHCAESRARRPPLAWDACAAQARTHSTQRSGRASPRRIRNVNARSRRRAPRRPDSRRRMPRGVTTKPSQGIPCAVGKTCVLQGCGTSRSRAREASISSRTRRSPSRSWAKTTKSSQ